MFECEGGVLGYSVHVKHFIILYDVCRKLFFFYITKIIRIKITGGFFVLLFFCTGVPGYIVYGLQQHHMDTFYSHSKNFVAFFTNTIVPFL